MKIVPISVVIPAYNSERYIGEAIRSALDQTAAVDEIIVVDNNSTDSTRKIAKKLGAKVIDEKQQGTAAARNRGIDASHNDWIAFLDSDDVWDRQKIEFQLKAIAKFPEARIVSSDSGRLFESDTTKHIVPILNKKGRCETKTLVIGEIYSYCREYTAELSEWFLINSSTMVFHREVFALIGLFDEEFAFAQDMEFSYRALAAFPLVTVKKNLAYVRLHENSKTRSDFENFYRHKDKFAKMMLRIPERYPKGIPEHFINHEKLIFLEKGRWLAKQRKQCADPEVRKQRD